MTQDQIEGELISLREQVSKLQQRHELQKTKLARWAVGFLGIFLVLTGITFTRGRADPGFYGAAMTFMFLALAFGSLAQPAVQFGLAQNNDGGAALPLRHAGRAVGAEARRQPAEAQETVGRTATGRLQR
jgi:hypothetical protein